MKKALGRIGLLAGGVFIALLAGECGVRIAGVAPERHRQPRTIENADKTAAIDAYPSNPRGTFDLDLRDRKTRERLGASGIDVSKMIIDSATHTYNAIHPLVHVPPELALAAEVAAHFCNAYA